MSSGKKSEKRISKHIENKVLYEIKCEILVFYTLLSFIVYTLLAEHCKYM